MAFSYVPLFKEEGWEVNIFPAPYQISTAPVEAAAPAVAISVDVAAASYSVGHPAGVEGS